MSQSESFDAFYARTSWTVTSQMHALAGEDPLADHAIREAYAKAYQQWYEVSTNPDCEAWVLGVAQDAYQRRLAEAAALGGPGPAAGHDPLSWPGMFRQAPQPVSDPDSTLAPRPGAFAGPAAVGPMPGDVGPSGSVPGGGAASAQAEVPPGRLFGRRRSGSPLAGGAPSRDAAAAGPTADWFAPVHAGAAGGGGAMPTATIGERADAATTQGGRGSLRLGRSVDELVGGLLRSRRNLIVVATAVVVLVAGGIFYALSGSKSGNGATPPASPGSVSKPAVHMLAAGQTGSRAAIPWRLIGPGWTLAEVSTAQPASNGSATGGGTHITYLVDPEGGKYRIRTTFGAAPPDLLAWSGNAKEALYGVGGATSYGLLALASGTMTPLPLPAGATALGFTRPDGLNILAVQQTNSKYRLERYDLSGAYQATIGTLPRPAGAAGVLRGNALSSPDGKTAVWGVNGAGMELVSNSGGLIRKLRMPGTGSPKSCTPMSWWSPDQVLAYCNAAGQPDAGRLWLVPAGGGQPLPLTGLSGSPSGQGVLTGAWQAGASEYVTSTTSAQCQGAPSGPRGQQILQLSQGGAETAVSIPGGTNNYTSVVAGVGGRLLVLAQTSCPGTSSLIWFNPSTHTAQTVLAAPSTEVGVASAVPYGSGPAAIAG